LRKTGGLERLLRSGARFAAKATLVEAVATRDLPRAQRNGCRAVVENLA